MNFLLALIFTENDKNTTGKSRGRKLISRNHRSIPSSVKFVQFDYTSVDLTINKRWETKKIMIHLTNTAIGSPAVNLMSNLQFFIKKFANFVK